MWTQCRSRRDAARTPGEGAQWRWWMGVLFPGWGRRGRAPGRKSFLGIRYRVSNLTLPLKKIPNLVGMVRLPPLNVFYFSFFSHRFLFASVLISVRLL